MGTTQRALTGMTLAVGRLRARPSDAPTPPGPIEPANAAPTAVLQDGPLEPAPQAIVDMFAALAFEPVGVIEHDETAAKAFLQMVGGLNVAGLAAAGDVGRMDTGLAVEGTPPPVGIPDGSNDVAYTPTGGALGVLELDLHASTTTMQDLCLRFDTWCEEATGFQQEFPGFVHGTHSARRGNVETVVGSYGHEAIDGVPTTVVPPAYVLPDDAALTAWEDAEALRRLEAELAPQDFGFLTAPTADPVLGEVPLHECIGPQALGCIRYELGQLVGALAQNNGDAVEHAMDNILAGMDSPS